MKKATRVLSALALSATLALGVMVGCSSQPEPQNQEATEEQLSEYEKIIETNKLESLAGTDGTLACTIETYEESVLDDTMAIEWKMTGGKPYMNSKDAMDDGIRYTMSEYSGDNCGALYSIENGTKYVDIYGQNDFSEGLTNEWDALIEYDGTQSDVVVNENLATLEVKQETNEGDETYYVAKYTFDPNTYVLQSLEVTDYYLENNEVVDKVLVKDIITDGNFELEQNPYQVITGEDESKSCNLTVVVNQLSGEQITSTYKVSRDSIVELMIAEGFDMYSDEGMTKLIDEIDVNAANATVYVKINEEEEGEDIEGDLGVDADPVGTEYVSEDGSVLTLGEDGNLYDESGNIVQPDIQEP